MAVIINEAPDNQKASSEVMPISINFLWTLEDSNLATSAHSADHNELKHTQMLVTPLQNNAMHIKETVLLCYSAHATLTSIPTK